jgi:exodeoxyribonuclease VII small subunit
MAKENEKKKTFEEALGELEKIVADVETGEIGLEESIDQYEAGMKLIKHCRGILDQAEKRIETINKETLGEGDDKSNSENDSV